MKSSSELPAHLASGSRRGLLVALALFVSHGVATAASAIGINDALAIALIATLAFAAPLATPIAASGTATSQTIAAEGAYLLVGSLAGLFGVIALERLTGTSASLSCAVEIPVRLGVAVFGAFAVAMLEFMVHQRNQLSLVGPLIYLGFFWIAPWYGFFQPPAFLAEAFVGCHHQTIAVMSLTFVAMIAARAFGSKLGSWLLVR